MRSPFFCSVCGAANAAVNQPCFACGHLLELEKGQEEEQDAPLLQDRYLLGGLLGEGGFSRVYRANDQRAFGRTVAIKEISLQGLSAQEVIEATETFYREMRVLSTLTHPQIPRLYDHFSDQQRWYLILEYIKGQTLETFLALRETQGPPLMLREILNLALQLCPVLSYLHQHRPPIIYRDLKPSNIIRTEEGKLVLIDFGIARTYRSGRVRDTQRLGSPGYAAPEQYGRGQTTPQSDIYSLGALLSFLLAGQTPAEEGQPVRALVPHSMEHEEIREDVAALAQRMREPDRSRRPQSCQEVAAELEAIKWRLSSQESTRHFRPPTSQLPQPQPASSSGQQQIQQSVQQGHPPSSFITQPISRRTMLIGLGMLTTTVVVGTVIGMRQYNWDHGTIVTIPLSTFQGPDQTIAMAWSPDSKSIVTVSANTTVHIWDAITGDDITPSPYEGDGTHGWDQAAVSPDGKRIVVVTQDSTMQDSTMQIWDIASIRIASTYQGYFYQVNVVAWSPDGKYIASVSTDPYASSLLQAQVWDAATGHTIWTSPVDLIATPHPTVVWSPDSKYIALPSVYPDTPGSSPQAQIWDAATGHTIWTSPMGFLGASMVWSPDGKYIASYVDSVQGRDAATGETTWISGVQVWDAATGHIVSVYQEADNGNTIAWSPDSKHIAATVYRDKTVQIWDAATGSPVLTYDQAHQQNKWSYARPEVIWSPTSWSPNGKYIASTTEDDTALVWDAATGQTLLTYGSSLGYSDDSVNISAVAWSPDGKYIATTFDDSTIQVWRAP